MRASNGPSLDLRVLTLPSATARQDRMRGAVAAAAGLAGTPWRFIHGIPPEQAGLRYDDAAAFRARGRTLSPAEVSCFAGHYALVRDWSAAPGSDYLLVLEDDVYLDPWFDFGEAARLMHVAGMDYLRLYGRAVVPACLLVYWKRFQVMRFPWSPGGAQAYLLSRAGARRLLAAVEATRLVVRPFDDLLDRAWETGNAVYALHPWPVLEHNVATTIHDPGVVRARQERQRRLVAEQGRGRLHGAARRVEALRERLARRAAERRLRAADAAVAARAKGFLDAAGFASFRAEWPGEAPHRQSA